jgi:hypothetical protein
MFTINFYTNVLAILCQEQLKLVFHKRTIRARAHQGNWQPQRNRNFQELLSASVEHKELTGAAQIEETAMQLSGRPRNSTSRQRNKPVFSQLRCHMVS